MEKILICGIGNRIMGDDGFAQHVLEFIEKDLPDNVELGDFSTASLTMANDLCDYDAVIFVDDLDYYDIRQLGPIVENARHYFPDRTNLMLVQVKEPNEVEIKIWERGAGATLSCGTGAVAAVVAGVLTGLIERKAQVDVPGGVLDVEYPEKGGCIMSGPAAKVFEGRVEV